MKKIIILFLYLIAFHSIAIAQTGWEKFESTKGIKSNNTKELSQKITKEYSDDLDKIKAIYFWVANNIRYDYGIVEKRKKQSGPRERYSQAELKQKRQDEISTALKRKKGVCQHYSLIFEELCLEAGIEAKFIGGLAKTRGTTANSHAWNAVKYKGEWHLIDVTYGSGGLNAEGKFAFNFEPNFFFVDKKAFRISHLPKDKEWQLLDDKIEKEEFITYLNIEPAYMEYDIKDLNQTEYKIKLKSGEDLVLEFKASKQIKDLICFKPKTGKRIEFQVEENNLNYRVQMDNSKIRSGMHLFKIGKKTLFSYQINKS